MHAVGAIELGARRQDVLVVDGVDHEQHGGLLMRAGSSV
jgi:hypothetical protein